MLFMFEWIQHSNGHREDTGHLLKNEGKAERKRREVGLNAPGGAPGEVRLEG